MAQKVLTFNSPGEFKEMEVALKKLEVELQVEANITTLKSELKSERIMKMKKILEEAEESSWKYTKIEDLIAF